MGLGQCIANTVLLDHRQLCEINEKQYNMGPSKVFKHASSQYSTELFLLNHEHFVGITKQDHRERGFF